MTALKNRIKLHEGCRLRPYRDSEGVLTAGYGRNLEAVPFSRTEVDLMFDNDFDRARQLARSFHVYEQLNSVRRGVLIEMVFQMGKAGVARFKNFLKAAQAEDWDKAHDEMLDSKWHEQSTRRCEELAALFRDGM